MESFLAVASSPLPVLKPFRNVSDLGRHKLLEIVRSCLALSLFSFFFFLRTFLSLLPSKAPHIKAAGEDDRLISGEGESGIARALSQMLTILNDVPVSSRKYEALHSLAEKAMDENVTEKAADVNRTVLSAAFRRAIGRLEAVMWWRAEDVGGGSGGVGRARPVRWAARKIRAAVGAEVGLASTSPEKLAAELLWMARKMVECGSGEEAVCMWGSASSLASMAVFAEPSLQCSLVKISAFLFKQAKAEESGIVEEGVKLKMLMSWLPLLCRASNGTDTPVLSSAERAEMESVLEEMIQKLSNHDQEKVLALWLYHFTSCPSSDWPNLQACYGRWYATSRKLFLLNLK